MKLVVLGSSSRGNSYILKGRSETLIIEAGIKLSQVKEALDFDISPVAAVLVSHSHNDHAEFMEQYLQAGIPILAGKETFQSKDLQKYDYLFREVKPGHGYKIGNFKVVGFDLAHDVPCLGYHISHPESGNILFLTDTYYCPYTFQNLNHILIETNYAEDIVERAVLSGSLHPAVRPRLMYTHIELETAKKILKANDLSKVINIILIHLSDGNSNQERFVREIRELTGKAVYAADKGLEIEMNTEPY